MKVSVVIPTLNEAAHIAKLIAWLRTERADEIIVADGGSQDGTVTLAQAADKVVEGLPGRARQMNAGATQATGDVLLFLHADCTLEAGALAAAKAALAKRSVIAGCFTMRVEAPGLLFRCIDWCASARVRFTGLVYGDQGLFLRRVDFERLGGFPPVQFMEDVLISQKLRRQGRIQLLSHAIFVSPRRWQKMGVVRQTMRNWALTALAAAGVHPDRLAPYYSARARA